jgi:hypothetical protein
MPGKSGVSRVETGGGSDPGSSYKDNRDGTIHVTHHNGNERESYDVKYGRDADDRSNALGNSRHKSRQ